MDTVILKCIAVLEFHSRENKCKLVWGEPLFVLNFYFYIFNAVCRLHLQSNMLACESFYKDLHGQSRAGQTPEQHSTSQDDRKYSFHRLYPPLRNLKNEFLFCNINALFCEIFFSLYIILKEIYIPVFIFVQQSQHYSKLYLSQFISVCYVKIFGFRSFSEYFRSVLFDIAI